MCLTMYKMYLQDSSSTEEHVEMTHGVTKRRQKHKKMTYNFKNNIRHN